MADLSKHNFSTIDVTTVLFVCRQRLSLGRSTWNVDLCLSALIILGTTLNWHPAKAETFDIASTAELNSICSAGNPAASVGAELSALCIAIGDSNGGNPASAGVGTQSQPNSILISQQQLKDAQTNKDKDDMPSGSGDVYTTHWNNRFSTFFTAGATTLRHSSNKFEQGYRTEIPSLTLGGGYLISKHLETGLAFNYSNSNGDYNSGGGFNVDSFSPLLYINYQPFKNAFTNLVLGYTRQNHSNNRIAVANKIPNGVNIGQEPVFRLKTSGEFNTNQYNLNFLSGYDFAIESFTIGPRVGVNVSQWEMDAYHESSKTGLELRYNSQHQTSIQTILGLSASYAHRFTFGTLIPQVSASWVHEFDNESRTIKSQFVQAPGTTGFRFETESPARDWAVIDLGILLKIKKGLQVFANFSTVQGNRNFESYGGNLGIRVGW